MESLTEVIHPAPGPRFRTQEAVHAPLEEACAAHPELASFHVLGESEEGRPLLGVVLGRGARTVSLIAGAHSDEPVGPETLRTLILLGLRRHGKLAPWLDKYRFVIVPHVNPDGEARNRAWIERWPDAEAYLAHVFRERPGRDLEFGFPAMRAENRLVADFLRPHAPFVLHMSLHGMAVGEGAMLLIERRWAARTQVLRDLFVEAARDAGLAMHDHNRKGEKGFFYIERGFTTTPEGEAMRHHFAARGDDKTAALFHDSSMEFLRGLGGDPLCLVTELPLFTLPNDRSTPGVPATYLAFLKELPALALRVRQGESIRADLAAAGLRPFDLRTAMKLQLRTLDLGLGVIQDPPSGAGTPL